MSIHKLFGGKVDAKEAYWIRIFPFIGNTLTKTTGLWCKKPVGLKTVNALLFVKIKLFQIDGKVLNCVLNGYPIRGNNFKLWEHEHGWSKFIISRCITLNEACKVTKSENIKTEVSYIMAKNTHL